jgi:hypothetical protein
MRLDIAPLLLLEAAFAAVAGPRAVDLCPALLPALPEFLGDDAEALVPDHVPLVARLGDAALSAGAWVTPGLAAVPDPRSDVLLVLEDAADRRWCPPFRYAPPSRDTFCTQVFDDGCERLSTCELLEHAAHDGGLRWVRLHTIAVRPSTTATIDAHLPHGLGTVAIGRLADREPPRLLAELSPQSLLTKIVEVELVHHAAHLEAKLRVAVVAVETVGA